MFLSRALLGALALGVAVSTGAVAQKPAEQIPFPIVPDQSNIGPAEVKDQSNVVPGQFTPPKNFIPATPLNCGTVKAPAEKAICNNAELREMDVEIANLYAVIAKIAMRESNPAGFDLLQTLQRSWREERATACGITQADVGNVSTEQEACLGVLMTERKFELEEWAMRGVMPQRSGLAETLRPN